MWGLVCGLFVVWGLSVVCVWFVCGLSGVCFWFVCGLSVVCLWSVCSLAVVCLLSVCCLSGVRLCVCLGSVCGLFVVGWCLSAVCLWSVWGLSVVCLGSVLWSVCGVFVAVVVLVFEQCVVMSGSLCGCTILILPYGFFVGSLPRLLVSPSGRTQSRARTAPTAPGGKPCNIDHTPEAELLKSRFAAAWSSGMILGLGPRGPGFNSRSSP